MSKKAKIIRTIIFYGADILVSTVMFVVLFHTPIFRDLGVFFYRGVILLVIAALFSAFLAWAGMRIFKKLDMDIKDMIAVFCIFFGVTLGWFILIPVTVERSISVYMLSYMDENDSAEITSEEFGNIFYDSYIEDFGAFEKRFKEQEVSGNIEVKNDGYVITDSGRFIVNMFRVCANLFDTDKWLVYPNEYTK